ncbi:MAG: hypothetical protein JNL40_11955 [Cyclobacteriaceae bacterium]|nr:hypothetical protein [Cyclobacteriaceae bacterium]
MRFLGLLLALTFSPTFAQQNKYKEIELGDNQYYLCSIELSPDTKTLAIGTAQGNLLFWDIETQQVTRKLTFEGFTHGPYMSYSRDGRYLLWVEQYFTDWALNKDRPSTAAVIDVASGNMVLKKDNVNAAAFTPDGQSVVAIQGNEIIFWDIATGSSRKKFSPSNLSNSMGISNDGKLIVVAQKPTEEDLKSIPSIRNDKKAIKEALKYREVAVFYDTQNLQRAFMANDIMDIVFSMRFTADGKSLFLFNAPNTKFRPAQGSNRNAYLQVVDPSNGEVSRTMFPTNAPEPIYKESPDGHFVAVTSVEHQRTVANSLLVFDRESGQTLKRFKNDFRLLENNVMGRACFEFLPDQKTIALGYGTRLVLWTFVE